MENGCCNGCEQENIAAKHEPTQLPALIPLSDDDFQRLHQLDNFNNWLIPEVLMLGQNPMYGFSLEPRERLARILDAGITVFWALQREVPPQEQLQNRKFALADEKPYRPMALKLVEERGGDAEMISFRRFGIQDMGIPNDKAATKELLEDIEATLREGLNVYLHCRGGVGRAGTIGALLLVHIYGLSADDALARVQQAYDTRQLSGGFGGLSPETDEQAEFVRSLAAELLSA